MRQPGAQTNKPAPAKPAATATKPAAAAAAPVAEKKQEVATVGEPNLPAVIDYGDDAGEGLENLSRDEFTIPFLRILQSNSPQVENQDPAGAAAGMFINTSTGEMYDGENGIEFIPCRRDHNFVEYVPRDQGGGFVGIHPPDEPLVKQLRAEQGKFGKLKVDETGNELAESWYLYCLVRQWDTEFWKNEEPWTRVVIGFASTQIKKYQNFIGRVGGIKYRNSQSALIIPPLYAHRWRATTVGERNKKGSFRGWKLALAAEPSLQARLRNDDAAYKEAKTFSDLIKEGLLKAAYEQADGGDGGEGGGGGGAEDIPGEF